MYIAALSFFFLYLFVSIILMAFLLRKSLKKTLYSYRNILLSGIILFFLIQLGVVISTMIDVFFGQSMPSLRQMVDFFSNYPRYFSNFAIPVMVLISLSVLISNISLIRHEGFRLHNLYGAFIGALYIGGSLILFNISSFVRNFEFGELINTILTYLVLFAVLVLCYLECVLIGTMIIGYAAAKQIPKYDKDFIIILGCLISKEGGLLPLLKGRTNKAIRFAWDQEIATGHKVLYVPSGGQGKNEIMSEGSAMELYLISHGAENDEVYPEKESRNTYENMLLSKRIIDSVMPNAKIAFATTNYHVLRSGILARRAGFDAEGIASTTKWYFWPNGFVREFFGILRMNIKAHVIAMSTCAVIALVLGILSYIF